MEVYHQLIKLISDNPIASNLSFLILGGGLAVYFLRVWVSARLNNSIKHEYDAKLEAYKTQLSISTIEHQVRFSKLHEKRAEVVAETYSCLVQVLLSLEEYTSILQFSNEPNTQEKLTKLLSVFYKFRALYKEKAIFYPLQVFEELKKIDQQILTVTAEYAESMQRPSQKFEELVIIRGKIDSDIKSILKDLEQEFRVLLGDLTVIQETKQ
jgi:hypothetical protein